MPILTPETMVNVPIRALFYGSTGAGKTYLCGTAVDVPSMLPLLHVDVESGYRTVRDKYLPLVRSGQVDVLTTTSAKDVSVIFAALWGPDRGKYRTVVIDSLTELYALLMNIHLTGKGREETNTQLQDYGVIAAQMLKLLRRMTRESTCHILCTAGEDTEKDEISGALRIGPDITGQMSRRAPRYFDIVGYLTSEIKARSDGVVRETKRLLQLQPYGNVQAKDRTPGSPLGALLEDPTMAKLYKASYGHLDPLDFSSLKNAESLAPEEEEALVDAEGAEEEPWEEDELSDVQPIEA
jgi:hypothetical protein